MSSRLLALENQAEQFQFIADQMPFLKAANIAGGSRFCHSNFVTCIKKLYKAIEDDREQGLLVLGTESSEVIILDKTCKAIAKKIQMKSVPVFLVTQGAYDVDYKIYVACRNGFTYLIANGVVSDSFLLHIESKPVGMIKHSKTIVVAGMNQYLYSFFNKGRLNFAKQMPTEITDLCAVKVRRAQNTEATMVALKSGEVRMFVDKYLIHIIKMDEPINGI